MPPRRIFPTSESLLTQQRLCTICAAQFRRTGPPRPCRRCREIVLPARPDGSPHPAELCLKIIAYNGDDEGQLGEIIAPWFISAMNKEEPRILIFTHRLGALYLPHLLRLLVRLRDLPLDRKNTSSLERIDAIMAIIDYETLGNPYFARAFHHQSTTLPEANLLLHAIAQHLRTLQQTWRRSAQRADTHTNPILETRSQLLAVVCQNTIRAFFTVLQIQIDREAAWRVLEPLRAQAVESMEFWSGVVDDLADTPDRIRDLLLRKADAVQAARIWRDEQLRGLHCAKRGCNSKDGLRRCSR